MLVPSHLPKVLFTESDPSALSREVSASGKRNNFQSADDEEKHDDKSEDDIGRQAVRSQWRRKGNAVV